MRVLPVCFLISLMGPVAQASADGCFSKLVALRQWPQPTAEVVTCLSQNAEYQQGTAVLCNGDRSDFSQAFTSYLNLESRYQTAFSEYQTARDAGAKSLALPKFLQAKEDMDNFGRASGLYPALDQVASAQFICTK